MIWRFDDEFVDAESFDCAWRITLQLLASHAVELAGNNSECPAALQ